MIRQQAIHLRILWQGFQAEILSGGSQENSYGGKEAQVSVLRPFVPRADTSS